MEHARKNLRFKYGKDANKMLLRKLAKNFILKGKLTTTEKKAKFLKPNIEILVNGAKKNSQSAMNNLKSRLADKKVLEILINQVAPVFKNRVGGYVRLVKLSQRESDGSKMARIEWT